MAEGVEHLPTNQNEQPQTIEGKVVVPDIIGARRGVEEFRKMYEAGDEAWRSVLRDTTLGQELQTMYLGLRPALAITPIYENERELLLRNIGERFEVCGDLVYDRDLVRGVMRANADIFSDYSPDQQSLDAYVEQLEHSRPSFDTMLKYGILHGYPKGAVTRFVKYYNVAYAFGDPSQSRENLTPSEQALLNGYVTGYSATRPRSRDERIANINKFRDEHETELKPVVEKVFPDIAEDAESYLLTERFVQLPGFTYNVGNPTQEDNVFANKVQTVFEASGMNAYVASLRSQE
jgi:hypothetical protein